MAVIAPFSDPVTFTLVDAVALSFSDPVTFTLTEEPFNPFSDPVTFTLTNPNVWAIYDGSSWEPATVTVFSA